jgi:ATP-dependent DNA ligase
MAQARSPAPPQWQPLKPKLVVEASFDHVTENRFRHGTKLLRWRPDKSASQCTLDQILPPKQVTEAFVEKV